MKQQVIYNGIDTEVFKPYDMKDALVKGVDWSKFTIMTNCCPMDRGEWLSRCIAVEPIVARGLSNSNGGSRH